MRRWIGVMCAIGLAACIESTSRTCSDGSLCPDPRVCEAAHRLCVDPDQLTACAGTADGAPCVFDDRGGVCDLGTCIEVFCGDGVAIGDEECDGGVAPAVTCSTLGFYDDGPVTCSKQCGFDTSACDRICGDLVVDPEEACDVAATTSIGNCTAFGFYDPGPVTCSSVCRPDTSGCTGFCGDQLVNGGEACEPGMSTFTEACVDLGYDAGHLECSPFCSPGLSDCRRIGWRRVASGTSQYVKAMWSAGPQDVFFGGDGATIHRLIGGQLTTFAAVGPVRSLWGSSGNDVWGVGFGGRIIHFDGTTWTAVTSPTGSMLFAVWGASANDIWAVGVSGTVIHYDGSTWTNAGPVGVDGFAGVWGTSASNIIAVGESGTIRRYNGTSWTLETSNTGVDLAAVWGTGPNDVFAVGTTGGIVHYNGAAWTPMQGPGPSVDLNAVWGQASDDVYAAGGAGTAGRMLHFDGTLWLPLESGASGRLAGLTGSAGRVIAAGESGVVLEETGAAWWKRGVSTPVKDVSAGTVPGQELVVVACAVLRHTGTSFVPLYTTSCLSEFTAIARVGNRLWVTDDGGTLHRYDGTMWTTQSPSIQRLGSVWASSATNAFVSSAGAVIFRDTGTGFVLEQMAGPNEITELWGASATDVFAVGYLPSQRGVIQRRVGGVWTTMTVPQVAVLRGVWGSSASDVYAVGDAGALLHFDGTSWTATGPSIGVDLFDIAGTGPNDVFVIGTAGSIFHYDGSAWTPVRSESNTMPTAVAVRDDMVLIGEDSTGTSLSILVRSDASW